MTTHITLRLAWHNDGWNGRICETPAENSYCVGCSSYPGEVIRERRDIEWEKQNAGKKIVDLDKPPACMYSASAFAEDGSHVESEPPEFFNDGAQVAKWYAPPATACTWPYEAMYRDEVKRSGGGYDADKRIGYANNHFDAIEANKSLVFYYANYSNPFSEDDAKLYVLVGVARVKEKGDTIYFDGCDERTMERYGGFVWQRNISSHYPDQGLRLPYHRYRGQPDVLQQFVVVPEATHLCKYASKHVSDDQALGLLEQLIESVRVLRDDIQDESEDWSKRLQWLETLIGELWQSRGAYPGMPAVLEHLGLTEAIDTFRSHVEAGKESDIVAEIKDFCQGSGEGIGEYLPLEEERKSVRRTIQLEAGEELTFLLDRLARCSISADQLKNIRSDLESDSSPEWGLRASVEELEQNLYLLAEQYQGRDEGDLIRWSTVDRGAIPSPELGAKALFEKNAPERVRSLLLETLRGNSQQAFVKADVLLEQVNRRVTAQPEWKQNLVSPRYLAIDKDFLSGALYLRNEADVLYLYDRNVWDQERMVQDILSDRLSAPAISLKRPVTESFWQQVLFDETSGLAESAREEYQAAIDSQKTACAKVFNKSLSILTGGAGTGKSTVVAALIKGMRKAQGDGVSVAVLAPTGKATDRLRRVMQESGDLSGVHAATIHSLLARHGWLNKENFSFKQSGGKPIRDFNALIIDESSMIDLTLMAALFRAIDWHSVQRLILVGDPAQLPPIGVGKVFADLVSFVREQHPENLAELKGNLRQLQNRVSEKGNGILDLAGCFLNKAVLPEGRTHEDKQQHEEIVQRLHEGGEFDQDLWVEYWDDPEELSDRLINRITKDLSDGDSDGRAPERIWSDALADRVDSFQVLCPVRGELYGTESINDSCQRFKSSYWLSRGAVDSITLFDKVIQFRNRTPSNSLHGYDFETKSVRPVEIYNGELGLVRNHPFDKSKLRNPYFRLLRFSVKFAGKENILVHYGSKLGKNGDGRWLRAEKPEENLEFAYAISVHKSQGSEFDRVYLVLPSGRTTRQDMELLYTALTRASVHCTVFIQDSVKTILDAMRPEQSALLAINSSLFKFRAVPDALLQKPDWYEAGKIHEALTGDMVRSKSEVIIANMLFERGVDFRYESQLIADDGSMYLPDFTIKWRGEDYYWEHVGMLHDAKYSEHWEKKKAWYEKHFPSRLLVTEESETLSNDAAALIAANFA